MATQDTTGNDGRSDGVPPARLTTTAQDSDRVCRAEAISGAEVADRVGSGARWIIVDDRIIDVDDFVDRHPGGHAVLRANIGRDASADFHHVSAHTRNAVTRTLTRLTVAHLAPLSAEGAEEAWSAGLLDYLYLVRNSFDVMRDDTRAPMLELVYGGQSFSQLISDHLGSFVQTSAARAGRAPTADLVTGRADLAETVREVVEDVVRNDEEDAAHQILRHIRASVTQLTAGLMASPDGGVTYIEGWVDQEHDYWCALSAPGSR